MGDEDDSNKAMVQELVVAIVHIKVPGCILYPQAMQYIPPTAKHS